MRLEIRAKTNAGQAREAWATGPSGLSWQFTRISAFSFSAGFCRESPGRSCPFCYGYHLFPLSLLLAFTNLCIFCRRIINPMAFFWRRNAYTYNETFKGFQPAAYESLHYHPAITGHCERRMACACHEQCRWRPQIFFAFPDECLFFNRKCFPGAEPKSILCCSPEQAMFRRFREV